jgi:succinate dehydrogenase / fumarate reductase cytochrome b subunit
MTRLGNFLASSVGKKIVMGLTGFLLVGFLVEHLHGNLKLIEDPSGKAFDDYVAWLQGYGPLLVVAEIGLALLFLAHVYLALRLTQENMAARRTKYVVRSSRGASTPGSISMFYSGALILGYGLKHLSDFRFDGRFFESPAAHVAATLRQPGNAAIYIAAALVLGLHLSHGFRSAFQSLGLNHPSWNPLLEKLGKLVALVFALGFAAIPIYFLLFWSPAASQ